MPFGEGALATPIVRPTNIARSVFHVAAGLVSLSLIRLLPGRGWLFAAAAAFACAAWTMEVLRRRSPAINARLMRFFGAVAHAHEQHHTNSSTWYVTALALIAAFTPMRAAELAVLVLGFADPAAGTVGRRLGKIRLSADRTLEGALAFLVVGWAVSFSWLVATGASVGNASLIALIGSVSGCLAELGSSRRFDDNFAIPMVVAVAVGLGLGHLPI